MNSTTGQPLPPPLPLSQHAARGVPAAAAALSYATGTSELSLLPRWIGGVSIVYAASRLILFCLNRLSDRTSGAATSFRYDPFWVRTEIAFDVLSALAALAIIVGAIGCLQRNQWGRVCVLIALITVAASDFCHALAMSLRFTAGSRAVSGAWMFLVTTGLYACHAIVLPIGIAWLLSRKQVRAAFQ